MKIIFFMILAMVGVAAAEETLMQKVDVKESQTVNKLKRMSHRAQDQVCEMVHGKMQCLEPKLKRKVKDLSDRAKTEGKEMKNQLSE